MEKIYGEEYKGDSRFVADCRKLQSIYRVEIDEEIISLSKTLSKIKKSL